jgi:hypothetical protein
MGQHPSQVFDSRKNSPLSRATRVLKTIPFVFNPRGTHDAAAGMLKTKPSGELLRQIMGPGFVGPNPLTGSTVS